MFSACLKHVRFVVAALAGRFSSRAVWKSGTALSVISSRSSPNGGPAPTDHELRIEIGQTTVAKYMCEDERSLRQSGAAFCGIRQLASLQSTCSSSHPRRFDCCIGIIMLSHDRWKLTHYPAFTAGSLLHFG
jgi:hypothetical protein